METDAEVRAVTVTCARMPRVDRDDWDGLQAAFNGGATCSMAHSWCRGRSVTAPPAVVRTGWNGSELVVLAELPDRDVFNPVSGLNAHAYQQGDVFEMFLQPVRQEAYFEIHVAPDNSKFQLRVPRPGYMREERTPEEKKQAFADMLIWDPVVQSRVRIDREAERWQVAAWLPLELIEENGPVREGTQWRFSFCRYDYTRGQDAPVLSSTTPHTELDFHRVQDWGLMTFA